ncbi:gephyrin-like molybdotransferase Glp [Mesorhizobium sp. KR9-304]|uniref:molybdopterin molybdotransferase MoeA n=1 Tax=Mesorhizobium sp. KR9-304 TaxID=3156614 RepID=UPI0032B35793
MTGLLLVDEAIARLLAGAGPLAAETVPLAEAAGRVLAQPVAALRTQPPFPASAMDGYAVRAEDVAQVAARLTVIGMAAAGKLFPGRVSKGEAVRIFTGAPVPEGADTIAIQENVRKLGGDAIEVFETVAANRHIRAVGLDFAEGQKLLETGRVLDAAALSLAAAANHPAVSVVKKPLVAIIATGDELLAPGSKPGPDQIIASNAYGVAAIASEAGARVLDLGIAPDKVEAISALVRQAMDAGADVIVTLGGASVGDHDLVQEALTGLGMELDFWKIAMRPGKPLMFGRLGDTRCVGLPGNPVASLVCSHLFLKPLLAELGGRTHEDRIVEAVLGAPMPANDTRQDYVRAAVSRTKSGYLATPFGVQDSSMLKLLADAGGLVVRAPHAPAAKAGDACLLLLLR